jgi:RHS repeat-associated protein
MVWTTSYYHFDAAGSTRGLTGDDQKFQVFYRQLAFGQQVMDSSGPVNPSRFIGQVGYYFDSNISLFNVRQRVYSAELARWLSQDPAKSDSNLYRYGKNNPLGYTDPSGLVLVTPAEDWGEKLNAVLEYINSIFPAGVAAPQIQVTGRGPWMYLTVHEGQQGEADLKLVSDTYWSLKNAPESNARNFALVTLKALMSPDYDREISRLRDGFYLRDVNLSLGSQDRYRFSIGGQAPMNRWSDRPNLGALNDWERSIVEHEFKPALRQAEQIYVDTIVITLASEVIVIPAVGRGASYVRSLFGAKAAAQAESTTFRVMAEREWQQLFGGVRIRKVGNYWIKEVNPEASQLAQWYGRGSLAAQARGLERLGEMAPRYLYRGGRLISRDVGEFSGTTSEFLRIWAKGSMRLRTPFNDIRIRNLGAGGEIFDPSIHPILQAPLWIGTGVLTYEGGTLVYYKIQSNE